MLLSKMKFSPSFALLVLCMVLLMLKAGFWQLDRAKQKRNLQQAYADVSTMPATVLQQLPEELADLAFRRVQLKGIYQSEYQFLLDNRLYSKRPGYEVLTPFCLFNGDCILVNRGWLAASADRAKRPDIQITAEVQTIIGIIYLPGRSFRLGQMDTDKTWPRLIQYLDYEQMAQRIGKPLLAATVILDADQAQQYRYNWQPVIEGPQKHYGYAVQWFAMALMVVILFVIFSIRSNKSTDEQREH